MSCSAVVLSGNWTRPAYISFQVVGTVPAAARKHDFEHVEDESVSASGVSALRRSRWPRSSHRRATHALQIVQQTVAAVARRPFGDDVWRAWPCNALCEHMHAASWYQSKQCAAILRRVCELRHGLRTTADGAALVDTEKAAGLIQLTHTCVL